MGCSGPGYLGSLQVLRLPPQSHSHSVILHKTLNKTQIKITFLSRSGLFRSSYQRLSFPGSVAWEQNWLTGKCSRARASTLAFRLWACGRCCWKKVFSTTVRLCVMSVHIHACANQWISIKALLFFVMQWTRSWASRTSTFSTASLRMSGRMPLSPPRKKERRAKRSYRTLCCSSRRLGPTPIWGWSWGNRTRFEGAITKAP